MLPVPSCRSAWPRAVRVADERLRALLAFLTACRGGRRSCSVGTAHGGEPDARRARVSTSRSRPRFSAPSRTVRHDRSSSRRPDSSLIGCSLVERSALQLRRRPRGSSKVETPCPGNFHGEGTVAVSQRVDEEPRQARAREGRGQRRSEEPRHRITRSHSSVPPSPRHPALGNADAQLDRCDDLSVLDTWTKRAAWATTADDVFRPTKRSAPSCALAACDEGCERGDDEVPSEAKTSSGARRAGP